jgi:hypothetical protein
MVDEKKDFIEKGRQTKAAPIHRFLCSLLPRKEEKNSN